MKWEDNVRRVVPYIPGEQPKDTDVIKLNTNECPYPPAPGVEKKLAELKSDAFRLYPDTAGGDVAAELCRYYQIPADHLFVGVGSDDVLATAFLTFFNSDKPVLFPDITYSFYDVWADLYKIPYKRLPLREDFTVNPEDYKIANGGIVIANPNAPTGIELGQDALEDIIRANPDSVIIVDEAYVDFGGTSALPLTEKYENVLVVQTFSKSRSMAGMRIGYAMGNPKLIGYMNDTKFSINSYTMNYPSLIVGAESVRDVEYFRATCAKIVATRERMKNVFRELGFTVTDSKTNFLFASHKTAPAKDIYEYLRGRKIFVRYWNKERINNRLRITIGTDAEMDALVAALKEYLA